MNKKYDTIIIGAGLTGCYLLSQLLKHHTQDKHTVGSKILLQPRVTVGSKILLHPRVTVGSKILLQPRVTVGSKILLQPKTTSKVSLSHDNLRLGSILLLESSPRLGGRIETIDFKDTDGTAIHYEAGGARFSDKHKRLNQLLKELQLYNQRIPITSDVYHTMIPANPLKSKYDSIMAIIRHIKKYIKKENISDSIINQHTLYSFLKDVMHDTALANYMIEFYEYYSELHTLNMSRALTTFTKEFNDNVQYYVLKSGYESIITSLMQPMKEDKHYKLNTLVTHIKKTDDSVFEIYTASATTDKPPVTYYASNVIVCVPVDALKKIKFTMPNATAIRNIYNKVKPEPLYRIYARFPEPLPFGGNKIATNLPIKYIIPMDHQNGVVMLSYTDGVYAKKLHKLAQRDLVNDTDKLTELLTDNLNQLLPYITEDTEVKPMKQPSWIKHYYWESGAGNWLPGTIPSLDNVVQPIPGTHLYLAGEQLSNHQAWVEGCLETADLVLKKLQHSTPRTLKHLITYRTKKNSQLVGGGNAVKKYSRAEVAKHNKPSDAWMIINKKVYNITKWISKHPGGNVILQGIGKDATHMFNNKGGGSGHSASAHKILERYYIGDVSD